MTCQLSYQELLTNKIHTVHLTSACGGCPTELYKCGASPSCGMSYMLFSCAPGCLVSCCRLAKSPGPEGWRGGGADEWDCWS